MGDTFITRLERWLDRWFALVGLIVIFGLVFVMMGVLVYSVAQGNPALDRFIETCKAQGNIPAHNGREWVCMENPNHAR
jgi:hypothetical protein